MNCLTQEHLSEPGYFPVTLSYYKSKWEGYGIDPHFHDRMEIMYVTEGRCLIHVMDKPITLGAFDFILLDANVPHDLQITDGGGILNVEIGFRRENYNATDLATLAKQVPALSSLADARKPFFVIRDEGAIFRTLMNLYDELDLDRPEDPATLMLLNYLLVRLSKAVRDNLSLSTSDFGYVERACQYIQEHLEEKIKVGDIAEHVHINSAYLQRLFRKVKGQTLVDYINEQRIILARNLLIQTDRDIAELAQALGFSSQQYFNYLFKHYLGVSPGRFRREYSGSTGKLNQVSYAPQRIARENLPEQKYESGLNKGKAGGSTGGGAPKK